MSDVHDGAGAETDQAAEWARVRSRLRSEFGEATYRSWLKPLVLQGLRGGALCVSVPTRFMRDWIDVHYAERIRTLWGQENPDVPAIVFVTTPSRLTQSDKRQPTDPDGAAPDANPAAQGARRELLAYAAGHPLSGQSLSNQSLNGRCLEGQSVTFQPAGATSRSRGGTIVSARPEPPRSDEIDFPGISAPLDPRATFENFVVGRPNELAVAAAQRVAEAQDVSFNPLFLYGGVGLGKTHLMHAVAWEIRARLPHRRVVYLSAENFTNLFIQALRHKTTSEFKAQFRSVDVLMVDDVQFIVGKDHTQEEFFHTFNALIDQNRQIVLSADKSPSDMEGLEERVRSRLGWGLVADIHPTTYELRLGILQSKAEQQTRGDRGNGLRIPERVLEFLAHRITSNVRELEGALIRLIAHATLVGRPITIDSAQEVLADLLRANDKRISIPEIQKQVAEYFNVRVSDMTSARRARAVARPRQVAMYLSKQLTPKSLPDIGRAFGGRDHTTVMHAVKKIDELRTSDPSFAEDIDLLRRMLNT